MASIEIRAVQSDELDAMVALMCEAFGLPFGPARELFLHDPYFDIQRKRVLLASGRIVSCLTLTDSRLRVGGAVVGVGGVAGLATAPALRRRGYATRLLLGSLATLRAYGYGLTGLLPFRRAYYRRLGWEMASTQLRAVLPAERLAAFAEARYVRAALPSDRAALRTLHEELTRGRTGACVRDDRRWTYVLNHSRSAVVFQRGGALEGYALFERTESEDPPPRLRVIELLAASEDARRGLVGHLAERRDCMVEYTAGWAELAASGLLGPLDADGEAVEVREAGGAMFRVVDLQAALRDLAPNLRGFRGRVTLCLHDAQAPPGAPASVTIIGDGTGVSVERADEADRVSGARIEGDAGTWAAVLMGHLSLADAMSLHRLHPIPHDAGAGLAPHFPRRDPFVSPPDYF